MRKFSDETIHSIENAVPIDAGASALDIWKRTGGVSHQHVKNGLKALTEAGRVLRVSERYVAGGQHRTRNMYQRVQS